MKPFNTIGDEELQAAIDVIKSGNLSGYIGSDPMSGPMTGLLEVDFQKTFNVNSAVAVNSATSGLLAACMAAGVTYGDEVIVSPFTMSATAAAPAVLGAKIVFADIELDTFCLDPASVGEKITHNTRAVIVTNLFGHPAQLHTLRGICDAKNVILIEDNAQGIFAKEDGQFAGTIGHMGVFSFNVHKQAQVGEGGVVVTNSNEFDVALREAMNHGEMRGGMLGLNLRMTEISAAMARVQLRRAPGIVASRKRIAEELNRIPDRLNQAYGETLLHGSITREGCEHAHYVWPMLGTPYVDDNQTLLSAMRKRGFVGNLGYVEPLYHLPAFSGSKPDDRTPADMAHQHLICLELCAIDPTEEELIKAVDGIIEECFR